MLKRLHKFLSWANIGLYHKANPLIKLEIQNDTPHYRVNEIDDVSLQELIQRFNEQDATSK